MSAVNFAGNLTAVILLVAVGTTGCVPLPMVGTTRPQSTVHVYGEDGHPLQGARVVIMVYGAADSNVAWDLRTDENGEASLTRTKSVWIVIFPFGTSGINRWSWCVEHTGHLPVAGSGADDEQMKDVYVQLPAGTTAKKCKSTNYFVDMGSMSELMTNAERSGNIAPR